MPFAADQEFSITQVANTDFWDLNGDIWYFDSAYTDLVIHVPAGYRSDGSSIPAWAWPLVGHPLSGQNGIVGFLHDRILAQKLVSRILADKILLEAHKGLGTPHWRRQAMYAAVRLYAIVKGIK